MKPWDTKNNSRQKRARRIGVLLANDLLAVDFPSVRTSTHRSNLRLLERLVYSLHSRLWYLREKAFVSVCTLTNQLKLLKS